jgi:two-component system CheB/CheR fusion protein
VQPSGTDVRSSDVYIVGIGASAGGLEALEELFSAMPPDSGMAFVVVQHLSPDFKSIMNELLARRTSMPVELVNDGVHVEPNHVYLIPPGKELILSDGKLLLADKSRSEELSLPIDVFFRSLAEHAGPRAVAIVLSGGGTDGSRGIRDVHEVGGLVLCQDEESAKFDSMPRSARDTGIVDYTLAPASMPKVLLDHVRGALPLTSELEAEASGSPGGIARVFRLLQDAYGIDFSHYKPNTVVRRIERRLQLARKASLDEYVSQLTADPIELDALYRDLLIGVTRFFRDAEAFKRIEHDVLPELVARIAPEQELRAWVAACGTGEEAYSVAILLHEAVERLGAHARIRVFATDVHRRSLDFAARGLYDEESVGGVSAQRLQRYFQANGSSFQVTPELRQLVVFAPHNVIRDAPFTRVDLLTCRNMLIYLQPSAQKRVLSMFHFALKRDGVLFLGPSETPGGLIDDFSVVDAHWRIYRKHRDLQAALEARAPARRLHEHRPLVPEAHFSGGRLSLAQTMGVYDALLESSIPASLLVNERRELVHVIGGAGRYLRVRDGRSSLDLLEMVHAELKPVLAGALQRALQDRAAVVYKGLRLDVGQGERAINLSVRPIVGKNVPVAHVLLTFEEEGAPSSLPVQPTEVGLRQVPSEELGALEAELRYTKESLQATIEELETSNEELQATNEELVAANEELQSTNEELQSVNEELYTVNAEYQKKISQLTELANDMDNLLSSTEVGTIFLDRELRIRKFTPRIAETFNLLAQDIGRPIDTFTNSLAHPGLVDDLRSVLESEQPVQREVRDQRGAWFLLRILPYRARGRADGVVLTLIDIEAVKDAEDALFRERHLLDSLLENVPDLIYFRDSAGRFVRVNRAMASRLDLADPARAVGHRAAHVCDAAHARVLDDADQPVLGGLTQPYELERHELAGSERWFMTTRVPLRDALGSSVGMFAVSRDVTEQKRAEDTIRRAVQRRDEFLAMLSHELRNPLGAIVNAAMLARERGVADELGRRPLDVIERQSRQMTRLLDDLLEVGRVTQNKIELRKQLLDARAVIQEAVNAMGPALADRGLELRLDLEGDALLVHADPARLQQVIVNLLSNAAKFTPRGGHVLVGARAEGRSVLLRVSDDGVGIDPAMVDGIFELFVQGGGALDRSEGGMGVGLTLVRSLVEMHGGTVTATSRGPGQGSDFVVRLEMADVSAETAAAALGPRRLSSWPRGSRIAVIEDNTDSREMLRHLLEHAGYEVHEAADGKNGLALIESVRPDIAIVDIGLPGMNGYEVARHIRASGGTSRPYLVALTGYGQPTDRAAALSAGFDEHLVKPLQPEDLAALLQGYAADVRPRELHALRARRESRPE